MSLSEEVAVQDPQAVRDAWITARILEFESDPRQRDRAIASILFDSLTLAESVGQMTALVQKEGLGGLMRGALNPFAKGKNGKT